MKLRDLLAALPQAKLHGNPETEISAITFDSRAVQPGMLFVAIRGWEQDGHRYIPDALRRGAAGIVAEEGPDGSPASAWVVVPSTRAAVALMGAALHDYPGRKLCVVGVTGTDGKTTTASLIAAILNAAGLAAGLLSTIRAEFGGQAIDTGLHTTTPNPLDVQRYLAKMVDAGMRFAVLETTSHALDQERTLGAEFDLAVVTNVTREHLDYHGSYGRYLHAKGKLFASLVNSRRKPGIPKVSVTNVDDVSYGYLREFPADRHLTYGIIGDADVRACAIDAGPSGARFRAVRPSGELTVDIPLPGHHNVYNALAAIAAAVALDVPSHAIAAGVAAVGQLEGRWERVATDQGFSVVIDFAHTPNALRAALLLARAECRGRVVVVFGCAGLRDQEKRPVMGEVAGRLADVVVLTAEDPRTEDVQAIMRQIASGCVRAGRAQGDDLFAIPDRAEAIAFAIELARPGDLILLAGKGHERSLCIGNTEHPWSEREAAAAALARRARERRG